MNEDKKNIENKLSNLLKKLNRRIFRKFIIRKFRRKK